MKKVKYLLLLTICMMFMFAVPSEAMSNTYQRITPDGTKSGSKKFTLVQGRASGSNIYDVYYSYNGETLRILHGIQPTCVTNGVYVYYSVASKNDSNGNYVGTIRRYNVVTGKSKLIMAGDRYVVCGAFADYLYMGNDNYADGINLFSCNVKTGGRKFMYKYSRAFVQVASNRVLVATNSGDMGNYPVYIFNLNGTNKIKIANAVSAKIKGSYVYYVQWNAQTDRYQMKRCSLTAENKTTVISWNKEFPQYFLNL